MRADAAKALGTGAVYVAGGTLLTNTTAPVELPGGLTQTATGTLALQLGAGDAGTISTAGVATLAGPLSVTFRTGYTPKAGDTLTLLRAKRVQGNFRLHHGGGLQSDRCVQRRQRATGVEQLMSAVPVPTWCWHPMCWNSIKNASGA